MGIDIFHPLSASPSETAAIPEHLRWQHSQGSPFGSTTEVPHIGVLGVHWLLDDPQATQRLILPEWAEADPLAPLFDVWFGRYQEHALDQLIPGPVRNAEALVLDSNTPLPDLTDGTRFATPLRLTSRGIAFDTESPKALLMVIDVHQPIDLIEFWNLRAAGQDVFPWPIGHGERVVNAAAHWLRRVRAADLLPYTMRGDRSDRRPYLCVYTQHHHLPAELGSMLRDTQLIARIEHQPAVGTLRGHHPLHTYSGATFAYPAPRGRSFLSLPMPTFGPPPWRPDRHATGIVAAQITFAEAATDDPDCQATAPNIPAINRMCVEPESLCGAPFQRICRGGRVMGVNISDENIHLGVFSAKRILAEIFDATPWSPHQYRGSQRVVGLIDQLGGFGSVAASEPALRDVLFTAARCPTDGVDKGKLTAAARKGRGSWPGPLASPDERKSYPDDVVRNLHRRGLFDLLIDLECPNCNNRTRVLPHHFKSTTHSCRSCRTEFPLSYWVETNGGRLQHRYRLAEGFDHMLLSQTWPIMSSISLLSHYHQPALPWGISPRFAAATMSCHVNVEIRQDSTEREIDFVVVADHDPRPAVILGEAKGGLGVEQGNLIDSNDLALLTAVQEQLRSTGIETFVLVAVMRKQLEDSERQALRELCRTPPMTIHTASGYVRPVFPIVLTGNDLSTPSGDPDHPLKWHCMHGDLTDLALESCRRHLGLEAPPASPRMHYGGREQLNFKFVG
ncbi:hypothetical protein [Streptomyces sp. NPDC087511]|uniref:hypothetical protein n=1 Tax=Streptomyces sp. NPDC087511 TaxID=3365792 RepID=UPI0037FBDAE6